MTSTEKKLGSLCYVVGCVGCIGTLTSMILSKYPPGSTPEKKANIAKTADELTFYGGYATMLLCIILFAASRARLLKNSLKK